MLDPTTGRPASVPDAPERAADAPEVANGARNPEPSRPVGQRRKRDGGAPKAEDRRYPTSPAVAQSIRGRSGTVG